jgi:hypothetical protein
MVAIVPLAFNAIGTAGSCNNVSFPPQFYYDCESYGLSTTRIDDDNDDVYFDKLDIDWSKFIRLKHLFCASPNTVSKIDIPHLTSLERLVFNYCDHPIDWYDFSVLPNLKFLNVNTYSNQLDKLTQISHLTVCLEIQYLTTLRCFINPQWSHLRVLKLHGVNFIDLRTCVNLVNVKLHYSNVLGLYKLENLKECELVDTYIWIGPHDYNAHKLPFNLDALYIHGDCQISPSEIVEITALKSLYVSSVCETFTMEHINKLTNLKELIFDDIRKDEPDYVQLCTDEVKEFSRKLNLENDEL